MYTDYKITDKPIEDMTVLQYQSIIIIAEEIRNFKWENKPMVVI